MDIIAYIIGKAIKNKSTIVLSSTAIIADPSGAHSFEITTERANVHTA